MLGASPPGLFAMECSRLYLNRLQNQAAARDTVVVIDVLRSFTTAAVALARGARAIYPVEGAAAAQLLAAELPQPLRVGAVGGGAPMPDFDRGNSPAALLQEELAGREVVLSTAAGVRGLQRFRQARRLYAASLVCARATAAAIRADGTRAVCFVITGEWVDRDGDEDLACSDYLEALLRLPGGPAPGPGHGPGSLHRPGAGLGLWPPLQRRQLGTPAPGGPGAGHPGRLLRLPHARHPKR